MEYLLRTVLILFCQGYSDLSDVSLLKNDPAFVMGKDGRAGEGSLEGGLPSQPTLSRLRSLFSVEGNREVLCEAIIEMASRIRKYSGKEFQKTMNIDGPHMETHGHQPGVMYNLHFS